MCFDCQSFLALELLMIEIMSSLAVGYARRRGGCGGINCACVQRRADTRRCFGPRGEVMLTACVCFWRAAPTRRPRMRCDSSNVICINSVLYDSYHKNGLDLFSASTVPYFAIARCEL